MDGWPNIQSKDNLVLGQVTGVAIDSKNQVHVFHRGTRVWDNRSVLNDILPTVTYAFIHLLMLCFVSNLGI